MGRRKKNEDSAVNDMCIACQFYEWQEDKYTCTIKGCRDNDKFQVYTPKWLRRDEDDQENN